MILACNHITKDFSEQPVLKDATFHINENDRVAVVGINGAGKTTLLRIIIGELSADAGEIICPKDTTIGYLPQQQNYHSDKTIYEELLSVKADVIAMHEKIRSLENQMAHCQGAELDDLLKKYHHLQTTFETGEGYTYQSKVMGVIHGLGFSGNAMHQSINTLSGGQKTRVALGKLLLTEPKLLIMDEPTNHLDMESIRWLENYLTSYQGSILVVSHDRYFLDRIATQVVEIDHAKVTVYPGNYSHYADKKAILRESQIRQYYNQQQEIKHQEAVIEKLKSFNREKSIKRAESREKMLKKIERLEKPVEYDKKMSLQLTPSHDSGKDVLSIQNFTKCFGEKKLFSDINFEIKRGEKVAIIGKNGTGKTTLLKMIQGLEPVDEGIAITGTNVEIGYYDQEHNVLHEEKTIFEEIQDDYPDLSHTTIRNVLAAFLFTGEDVFKPISLLSGGEKGRISLAKLMLSKANFLLLDEPTNHLDILSKEILETALRNYTGTVLYVSHDRYFIDKTATRILDLTNHQLLSYIGNYQYYLEKKETVEQIHFSKHSKITQKKLTESDAKNDWQEQKRLAANRKKIERQYKDIEDKISELEESISYLEEQMALPEYACDAVKLNEFNTTKEEKEKILNDAFNKWEQLAQQLESMDSITVS